MTSASTALLHAVRFLWNMIIHTLGVKPLVAKLMGEGGGGEGGGGDGGGEGGGGEGGSGDGGGEGGGGEGGGGDGGVEGGGGDGGGGDGGGDEVVWLQKQPDHAATATDVREPLRMLEEEADTGRQPAAQEEADTGRQPAAQVAADSLLCPLDDEDVLLTVLQQSGAATLLTATAVSSMWTRLARAELGLRRISWPRATFGELPHAQDMMGCKPLLHVFFELPAFRRMLYRRYADARSRPLNDFERVMVQTCFAAEQGGVGGRVSVAPLAPFLGADELQDPFEYLSGFVFSEAEEQSAAIFEFFQEHLIAQTEGMVRCMHVNDHNVDDSQRLCFTMFRKYCESVQEAWSSQILNPEMLHGDNQYHSVQFGHQDAVTETRLTSFPSLLLIDVDSYDYRTGGDHIGACHVQTTLSLPSSPIIPRGSAEPVHQWLLDHPWREANDDLTTCEYELYAALVRQETTFSFFLRPLRSGVWFRCPSSHTPIRRVADEMLAELLDRHAHVLVYVRRDAIATLECDGSSSLAKDCLPPALHQALQTTLAEAVPVGTRVRVRGLAGRAEFNGRTGVTISCQDGAKGRVAVRLDSGERLALKLSNLFVVW